jgi:hypothetical protein
MAHQNELTDIALNELKAHGIKGHLRDTNGGHIEITWQVVPEKEVRQLFVAKTTSDWRSRMNTRANVRKMLRADNVTLKMQEKPKKPHHQALTKALSIPTEVTPIPDQIAAMRSELADLTELVMRLFKVSTTVRDNIATYVPPPPPAIPAAPQSSRSVKLVEYLSHDRWVNIDTLPRDTGLKPEQIKLKLQYLKNHDQIEIFRGQVKLNAPKPEQQQQPKKVHWKTAQRLEREAAAKAAEHKTNGAAHPIAAKTKEKGHNEKSLHPAGARSPARATRKFFGDATHGGTVGEGMVAVRTKRGAKPARKKTACALEGDSVGVSGGAAARVEHRARGSS